MRSRRAGVVLTVLTSGALAAPAEAQVTRVGGGAPLTRGSAPVLVSAQADRGAGTVRFTVDTALACEGTERTVDVAAFGTAQLSGESFQATLTRQLSGGAPGSVTITIQGTFAEDGASGRVQVTGRAGGRDCAPGSPVRAWRARTLTTPAGRPTSPASALDGFGLGDRGLGVGLLAPVITQVDDAGRQLAVVSAARAICTRSKEELPLTSVSPVARIRSGGRFRADVSESTTIGDVRARVTYRLGGRVRADAIGGALRIVVRVQEDGRTVDTCTTGLIEFAARA